MKNYVLVLLLLAVCISLYSQETMTVTPEGSVGIGTPSPQSELDVNGRIRDKTGFVMPVGTILPFAGDASKVPEGWLVCDGRAMLTADYPDLFAIIETNFGDGSTDTRVGAIIGNFNLPDLRGVFIRGADTPTSESTPEILPAYNDPDFASRTAQSVGGNTGDAVGSVQEDAFQGWQGAIGGVGDGDPIYYSKNRLDNAIVTGSSGYSTHGLVDYLTTAQGDPSMLKPANNGTNGDPRTSNETRPKNVILNYIIKY